MIQHAIASVAQLPNHLEFRRYIAKIQAKMLAAEKLSELHALIVTYSHEELNQVYNQLTPEQQSKIDAICDRDSLI